MDIYINWLKVEPDPNDSPAKYHHFLFSLGLEDSRPVVLLKPLLRQLPINGFH